MGDDPRRNLKRLEQALLYEDLPEEAEEEDLLYRVDQLIEDMESEEEAYEEDPTPIRNFANRYGRETRGEQAVRRQAPPKLDKDAAVLVKSRRQLRREAKQQKIAEKKAGINRSLKGLVFLAILECMGILAILGWWLQ